MSGRMVHRLRWAAVGAIGLGGITILVTRWSAGDVRVSQLKVPPFLEPRKEGLVSVQHTYTDGESTVLLIPMVHLGEYTFYNGVLRECYKAGALILEEAVIPPEAIADYRTQELLDNFGEVTVPMLFPGIELRLQRPTRSFAQVMQEAWYVGRANLGPLQYVFSPTIVTQQYFISLYHEYCRWKHADTAADMLQVHSAFHNRYVFSRLNKTREDRLMGVLQECLKQREFQVFAIPWGAAHCHTIERRLMDIGFKKDMDAPLKERLVMNSLDFKKLISSSSQL